MLVDFHSHTTLSDGTLSFDQMVEAAERRRYDAFAITDHARVGESHREIAATIRAEIDRLAPETPIRLFAGVELTDFPPEQIARVAEEVRDAGAQVVVVHGECVALEVVPGTNAAAVRAPGVDILAHPGLISDEDAALAASNAVYLELSAIVGASYANGHVYRAARRAGALVVVDSDAHEEKGMLSHRKVEGIIRGAGAPESYVHLVRDSMAPALLNRLMREYAPV